VAAVGSIGATAGFAVVGDEDENGCTAFGGGGDHEADGVVRLAVLDAGSGVGEDLEAFGGDGLVANLAVAGHGLSPVGGVCSARM